MVVGRDREEAVYIAELYLALNYLCIPVKPLAVWFLQLLSSPSTGFNILAEAMHELDDWEPYTKVICY